MKAKLLVSVGKFLAIFVLCLTATEVWSQNSEYKVFYFSGNPLCKAKNKTEKIVRDQAIAEGSTISIPENSYVVLVNKSEVPMGINKAGDYTVTDIKKLYTNMKDSNLTEEFFDYIASSMVSSNDKNRRSGGVYRAVGDLMQNPFDSAFVLAKTIPFEWNNPNQKQYYLKIFNVETWDIICDIPTTDSLMNVDVNEEQLVEGKQYAWVVTQSPGIPQSGTELMLFTVADKCFKKEIDKKLSEATKKSENDQMRKMMKIRIYIDNNVYPIPAFSEM